MCSGSSIKSFVSSDLQFSRKSWYLMSRNRCSDVQNGYKTILECSSNHLVRFWMLRQPQDHSNLGWIDDCTYLPFSCKFKQNKQHPKWPSTIELKSDFLDHLKCCSIDITMERWNLDIIVDYTNSFQPPNHHNVIVINYNVKDK